MIDPQKVPRFAGVPTFMRQPHVRDLDEIDADAAFVGVPYDDATTYRPGARFGPRAIREASTLLKPYNPVTETDFGDVTIVDHDDVPVVPGYTEATLEVIEERLAEVVTRGVLPVIAGGDHSTTLAALRAVADEHGPLSLVQFDAHSDLWTEYFGKPYNHGTTVHHALEEGLIDPESSIRIGDRGALYDSDDESMIEDAGIEFYTAEETFDTRTEVLGQAIRDRVTGPAYVTLDIDVIDPAFAPGTGTPVPGGLASRELISLVWELHGIDVVGFDLVEVSPPYDQSDVTALLAARLMYETLSVALAGR